MSTADVVILLLKVLGLTCALAIALPAGALSLIAVKGLLMYWKASRRNGIATAVARVREKATFVPLSAISPNLSFSILFAEDPYFYGHRGLVLKTIWDALRHNLRMRRIAAGGSTLTQQLAKNLLLCKERLISRKIAEVFAVRQLEKRYSKDELLELYVNCISYGCGDGGISEACRSYFSSTPAALTAGQAAMLAEILPAPKRFSPLRQPAFARYRQQAHVLRMFRNGHLEREDAQDLYDTGKLGGPAIEAGYVARRATFLAEIRRRRIGFFTPDATIAGELAIQAKTIPPRRSASGLVEFARMCLGLKTCYMLGAMGELVTDDLIDQKREQFPDAYPDARVAELRDLLGQDYRGFDCSGLIKSYYFGGIHNLAIDSRRNPWSDAMLAEATIKGTIESMPEQPGLCVSLPGHIGIYVGDGMVIECTSTLAGENGVVMTRLDGRPWTHWLQCRHIEYEPTSARFETDGTTRSSGRGVALTTSKTIPSSPQPDQRR